MIQVWKCDFCLSTNVDSEKIRQHEIVCSFNKINKKCYTCKFRYEAGYNGEHIPGCGLNLSTLEGEDVGNCSGWIYEYIDEERNDKLEKLGL
jgi:hypothetical protein